MLIPVLVISCLVHFYSIGYMSHDPRGCVRGKRDYGDKLTNSGNTLKLLMPSNIWKDVCGWTNYTGKVTSQEIVEKQMGNRGSKSITNLNIQWIRLLSLIPIHKFVIVKEQRVYGSLSIKLLMDLRFTLKGNERGINLGFSSQICWSSLMKIPSKQFRVKINYSTYTKINPRVWSGLIDGDKKKDMTPKSPLLFPAKREARSQGGFTCLLLSLSIR